MTAIQGKFKAKERLYASFARRALLRITMCIFPKENARFRKESEMNSSESCESLLEVGFTPEQIEQLSKFRQVYAERERQQSAVEQRRLEFVRWLVTTGRLTEQVV